MQGASRTETAPSVLVTGAAGFVGRRLLRELGEKGYWLRAALRRRPADEWRGVDLRILGEIGARTDWRTHLAGIEAVVHLAARVHVRDDGSDASRRAFERTNVEATANLARQAAECGLRRFLFMSSIGARLAEEAERGGRRASAYQDSKLAAERALAEIAAASRLELVILRPPLVYGAGAPGSFALLQRALASGLPLPLAALSNRRSQLYLGNLTDAIRLCLERPEAAGRTFELADGPPVTPAELVRALAEAQGRPARLFPCPAGLLRLAGRALGRGASLDSLTEELIVDDSPLRDTLGWTPPYDLASGLAEMAAELASERAAGKGVPPPERSC